MFRCSFAIHRAPFASARGHLPSGRRDLLGLQTMLGREGFSLLVFLRPFNSLLAIGGSFSPACLFPNSQQPLYK